MENERKDVPEQDGQKGTGTRVEKFQLNIPEEALRFGEEDPESIHSCSDGFKKEESVKNKKAVDRKQRKQEKKGNESPGEGQGQE